MAPSTIMRTMAKAAETQIQRCRLTTILEDGTIMVALDDQEQKLPCDVLEPLGSQLDLKPGQTVLVSVGPASEDRGVILGTVGKYLPADQRQVDFNQGVLRHKTIEIIADEKFIIRCGDSKLSMGPDGTIIIRGKRILSKAKGVNKIKGAAVQIN